VYSFGGEVPSSKNTEKEYRIRDTVVSLRERGGLVTYDPKTLRLYAFGQTEVQAQQTVQPGTASTEARVSLHLDSELDLRCKFPFAR